MEAEKTAPSQRMALTQSGTGWRWSVILEDGTYIGGSANDVEQALILMSDVVRDNTATEMH